MLVYDDTFARAPAAPSFAEARLGAPPRRGPSIRSALALLRRRALWILGCALIGASIAVLAGKLVTPRYTAEAQLYIDPRDLRLVDKELTPTGQDATGFMTIVESQAQVITSSNVLGRVVRSLDLAHDLEFTGGQRGGLLAALGLSRPPPRDPASDAEAALDALDKRVAVRRTGRTFIVDVTAWSRDPERAAQIANAVAAAYLAEEAATRAEAASKASAGLSARLVELREAVNAAESRVQAYKVENGLVGTRDALVSDQQLTQLNAQLASARVRAADAQARVDQLQRIQTSGSDAGATEDALASPAIASLRTQHAELSRRQAELLHDLGPRHPLVTSINSQIGQVRRLIDQESARYGQAARTDLARAQATVAALERSFDSAKGKTVGQAQASIRLRELEREQEASRAVYQAFLVRAQETGQQARLDVGNARVITPAVRPPYPSYPPPARTLALIGLAAGLLLGIGLAVGEDRLRRDMEAPRRTGWASLPEPIERRPASRLHGHALAHGTNATGGFR